MSVPKTCYWMDGWMDGWMDVYIHSLTLHKYPIIHNLIYGGKCVFFIIVSSIISFRR